jgi:hypothetical protein
VYPSHYEPEGDAQDLIRFGNDVAANTSDKLFQNHRGDDRLAPRFNIPIGETRLRFSSSFGFTIIGKLRTERSNVLFVELLRQLFDFLVMLLNR